jgi:hypothetical protein
MSKQNSINWRLLQKECVALFFGAILFTAAFVAIIGYIDSRYYDILLLIFAFFGWSVCAWKSFHAIHVLHVLAAAASLTWGITFWSLIKDGGDNVFLPFPYIVRNILVIPVITTITVLPFWFFGKRRYDWKTGRTELSLKMAIITLLTLIVVYILTFSSCWFFSHKETSEWRGKKVRDVLFETSIGEFWEPAFWFVEHFSKYQRYSFGDEPGYQTLVFRKVIDAP